MEKGQAHIEASGAVWHRVDFHLHSPGVESFTFSNCVDLKTEGGRRIIAEQYVEQLVKEGIKLCALTDYNGIRMEWFPLIRQLAEKYGIMVLPGVEISFAVLGRGLHILAVFGKNEDPGRINMALQALDKRPGEPLILDGRKHRDIDLRFTLTEAINDVRGQFPCLIIVPHPDEKNGICKSFETEEAAKHLVDLAVDAIEHCPESEIHRLRSTGRLDSRFFEQIAQVEFSDPKQIGEIGAKTCTDGTPRATYLKLSAFDISALRLALHDKETRVALGSCPVPRHARITGMEVEGTGFLGGFKVAWNPELNAIIGGRGAGKSAVLETLRYALGARPYAEESYREDLVRHALGSGGKVVLRLDRPAGDGFRSYRVERVFGDAPIVYDESTGRRVDVFPIEVIGQDAVPAIFGQREIYTVSDSEEYRLRLLDDLIGEEARQRAATVQEAVEALRDNARRLLDVGRRLAKREEYVQRLMSIEHEISTYEREGVADKLRKATDLRADEQHLQSGLEAVRDAQQRWQEARDEVKPLLARALEVLDKGRSIQKEILDEAAGVLRGFAGDFDALWERGKKLFEEALSRLSSLDAKWQGTVRPLDDELNRIKRELHAEALDPDRLLRLNEERESILLLLQEFQRAESEESDLRARRRDLLDDLKGRRLDEHKLRRERAEEIASVLGGRLRLHVEFKGQKEDYRRRLASLLKGSRVTEDALEKLIEPEATDGIALAAAVRAGQTEVEQRYGLTPGMAQRLVQWFCDGEGRLFELETLIPPDTVRVELRVDGQYRPLEHLSIGQRATAILLLLFAQPNRILVLDQPEDDLDNRFVYEDIVSILREQKVKNTTKSGRQVITATHNANIPVLGDAELVLPLEARNGHAHVLGRASVDDQDIRSLIKSLMEGGEDAFRRRAEKYGGG